MRLCRKYFSKACLCILLSKCLFLRLSFLIWEANRIHLPYRICGGIKHNSVFKEVDPEYTLYMFLGPWSFFGCWLRHYFCLLLKGERSKIHLPASPHCLNEGHLPSGLIPHQQSVICLPNKNTMRVPLCYPRGPPPTAPSQFRNGSAFCKLSGSVTLGVLVQLKSLAVWHRPSLLIFGSTRGSEKAGLVLGLGLEQIIPLTLLSLLTL